MNKNKIYFPEITKIKENIAKLGATETRVLYNTQNLRVLINETFQEEYLSYVNNEEYFPGCPFKIYKKHYQSRLKKYYLSYPGADEEEYYFLEEEDAVISRLLEMSGKSKNNYYFFFPHLDKQYRKNLSLPLENTRKFIDNRLRELGHGFQVVGWHDPFDMPDLPREYWTPQRNPDAELDLNPATKPEPSSIPKPEKTQETKISALETAYLAYYFIKSGAYHVAGNVETQKDWIYFSKLGGGASPDNIRKSYKEIEYKEDLRLKTSRLSKIQNAVSFIKIHFPQEEKVLKKALADLQAIERKTI